MKPLSLEGRRFGRLVAIRLAGYSRPAGKVWVCRCDCGVIREAIAAALISGKPRSCGCLLRDSNRTRNGEGWVTAALNYTRNAARCRGIKFSLSWTQVKVLVTDRCVYCGVLPSVHSGRFRNPSWQVPCNGIDRVDSSRGYTIRNCVPCCKECNHAKRTMTYASFRSWAVRLYGLISKIRTEKALVGSYRRRRAGRVRRLLSGHNIVGKDGTTK